MSKDTVQTQRRKQLPFPEKHRIKGMIGRSRRGPVRAWILVLVHVAIIAHIAHWKVSGGSLTPMEPSEAMQTLELGYLNAGFVLFVLLILITMITGRFFCGWACHLVAYQDAAAWLLGKVGVRPRPVRSRLLILVPFGAAFYMFIWPQVRRVWENRPFPELENHFVTSDFWQTFPGPIVSVITLLVCGMIIIWVLGSKAFCTYGCPYGAFFGIADRFAPGKIRVTDDCEQCGHCTEACTSNVRVHEEVAKFKMVVDTGCMKCMDCVSVCPKNALFFGRAKPSILSLGTIRRRKKRTYDFSWPEEIVMALVFFVSLYAWRGLYDAVPFLLALGLSVLGAFGTIALWRFLRYSEFQFQHWVLRDGGVRKPGWIIGAVLSAYLALTLHSVYVQYQFKEGRRLLLQAEELAPAERSAVIDRSLQHLQRAESAGIAPVGALHLMMGSIFREQGDLPAAETEMRAAIDARPDMRVPRVELARMLIQRDALDEAEQVLQDLLERHPEDPLALDWLGRLQQRPTSREEGS